MNRQDSSTASPDGLGTAGWRVTLAAAALMALVIGSRSAIGLFVSPLNSVSGLGLAKLSFALAVGQLLIGFAQPIVGALADRRGAAHVIVAGALLLALTTALPVAWPVGPVVAFALVASATAGCAVASNGLLLGEVNRVVPVARAGLAVGIIGAGASVGQLALGPTTQWLIEQQGWSTALLVIAALSLVALPLALPFRRATTAARSLQPSQPVGDVLRDRYFWRIAGSFGICGFHIAFLGVHMPGVIERCGLPASLAGSWIALAGAANIAGSFAIGLAMKRYDAARLLSGVYAFRALGIGLLLALPASPAVLLGFAIAMGASHMATLPPTSQLVAQRYGVARLGTLLGAVMLVHQVGSFAGIWLGGLAAELTGSDRLLWTVDIMLAIGAAVLVWPHSSLAPRPRMQVPAMA